MRKKQHVVLTYIVFGQGFDEVHDWIDSDAKNWLGTVYSPFRHWVPYHHKKAIDEKYQEDDIRRVVAYLHVVCDWLSHFGLWNLPLNSDEVQQLLWELEVW